MHKPFLCNIFARSRFVRLTFIVNNLRKRGGLYPPPDGARKEKARPVRSDTHPGERQDCVKHSLPPLSLNLPVRRIP